MQSMLPSRHEQSFFNYWRVLDVPQRLYLLGIILIVVHACFLLVPSSVFDLLGIHANELVREDMPGYIQFAALHSTTLFLYWVSYPYIAGVNALMFLVALNSPQGFSFFSRIYLRDGGAFSTFTAKLKIWLLMSAFWTVTILVVWVWPQTPNRRGFHPVENPIMLFMIYGGAFSMIMPPAIAVLLTDVRSWFFKTTYTEE